MSGRLFCYAPQKLTVAAALPMIPRSNIFPVDTAYQLQGHEFATFLIVSGHPKRIPRDIWGMIEVYGFNTLTLNDEWARKRRGA